MRVIFSLFFANPDEIIGADTVKFAKADQILDLQLGSAFLDMAISLLGFVDDLPDLLLRQIPVLAQISHSFSVIHKILIYWFDVKSVSYSIFEY